MFDLHAETVGYERWLPYVAWERTEIINTRLPHVPSLVRLMLRAECTKHAHTEISLCLPELFLLRVHFLSGFIWTIFNSVLLGMCKNFLNRIFIWKRASVIST